MTTDRTDTELHRAVTTSQHHLGVLGENMLQTDQMIDYSVFY